MNTNLRERSEYRTQTRHASFALRLPPFGSPEPTRRAATRRHWARVAAREVGEIAELMLTIWFQIVVALVSYTVMVLMSALFDLEIVDCGSDG